MIDALYIHIPFCDTICTYCDFTKMRKNEKLIDAYFEALLTELKGMLPDACQLTTIYIGGGTPSAVDTKYYDEIFQLLNKFKAENCEFTFEANPNNLSLEYLKYLWLNKVNRLSIGVQTFNDNILAQINRSHKTEDVYTAITNARAVGFDNITIDLMFALPFQTIEDVKTDLKHLFLLEVEHVSIYSLIIERLTPLYKNQKKLMLPSNDVEADMYEYIIETLTENGYIHYEMSNFSKTERLRSKHNLKYWHQHRYFAAGLGASGFIGNVRYKNETSIVRYLKKISAGESVWCEEELVEGIEAIEEACFLSLRDLQDGLNIEKLQKIDEQEFLNKKETILKILVDEIEKGNIFKKSDGSYCLTRKGLFIANNVFENFVQI